MGLGQPCVSGNRARLGQPGVGQSCASGNRPSRATARVPGNPGHRASGQPRASRATVRPGQPRAPRAIGVTARLGPPPVSEHGARLNPPRASQATAPLRPPRVLSHRASRDPPRKARNSRAGAGSRESRAPDYLTGWHPTRATIDAVRAGPQRPIVDVLGQAHRTAEVAFESRELAPTPQDPGQKWRWRERTSRTRFGHGRSPPAERRAISKGARGPGTVGTGPALSPAAL